MRTFATLLLAFLLAPAFAQTPCDGADHTILAGNFYYNPASLTVNAGETVAWVNEGGFHDVNGNVSVISGESFGNPEVFSLPSISGDADGVCMGTHTFTVPGTYNYDCSIGSHAANGMVASITVVTPSSVDESNRLPWQFMPNPAADALRVVWGGEAAIFEVFDLNGRRVHTTTVYCGVTTLELTAVQPGLYLAGPQGSELQRLAIQR